MRRIAITLLLIGVAGSANAAELVREFKGTGNTTTASFAVEGPWLLDWRLESPAWQTDSRASRFSALEITLVEANTGRHVGRVKYTKRVGNGLRLFESSGRYQLKISTTHARWTVRIEQLTEEEAELYTPK
ncbi:MAG: hypothetical protein AAFN50_07215 [Pseudomonadota bacterium]